MQTCLPSFPHPATNVHVIPTCKPTHLPRTVRFVQTSLTKSMCPNALHNVAAMSSNVAVFDAPEIEKSAFDCQASIQTLHFNLVMWSQCLGLAQILFFVCVLFFANWRRNRIWPSEIQSPYKPNESRRNALAKTYFRMAKHWPLPLKTWFFRKKR